MSPFSATLRRLGPSLPRSAPKSTRRGAASAGRLPPEKLRALISLYHQSETFINEDNLMQRINEALIDNKSRPYNELQLRDLTAALEKRRDTPKTSLQTSVYDVKHLGDAHWSLQRVKREREAVAALYGTDPTPFNPAAPGLELVQGESAPAKKAE
ncbi:hypothetical protein CC1G_00084 [Coprinopsis cinerea okayama7|uniref:Uncharacterized protein n=1 Tax=Coprinopsis cinerea (strain Okayama-7 / 130 / ATCC MYA-4618 / FGSC 9003) TaxID=240176 RepID=A8NWP3_COPC7|nr:hypothetical protein CC1G_00084 [Coprinopsis cinerea okayama7\|eukprot:XP_001836948.1 hypothetical protein CC1G_00084 [Coprinopsis cinerea okayama7\